MLPTRHPSCRAVAALFAVILSSACDRDIVAPAAPLSHTATAAALINNLGTSDLGTLGGAGSFAHAVNATGQIVGEAQVLPGNPWPHAYITTASGALQDLGTLPTSAGQPNSRAMDINDAGTVVGQSSFGFGAAAFVWTSSGGMRALPDIAGWFGTYAEGISENGLVAGGTQLNGFHNAVMWTADEIPSLAGRFPGDGHTIATDINSSGLMVGFSFAPTGTRGWIWSRTSGFREIRPMSGGRDANPRAINDAGQVVGWVSAPGGGVGFLWTEAGGMKSLGKLADAFSCRAEGISNDGVVTGGCNTPSGSRAVMWTEADGITDMGPGMGAAVNDNGVMVGTSAANVARRWSYSITPDPETPAGVYSLLNGKLVRVDPGTGAATVVMSPTRDPACCVAADASGWIYATHSDPRFARSLMRMRPAAGVTQQMAALSQSFHAMAFHPTLGLIGADGFGHMYRIDPVSGNATYLVTVAPFEAGTTVQDLAVLEDGTIYGIRVEVGDATRGIPARGTTLFKLNPTTLVRSDIRNLGRTVFMTGLTDMGADLLGAECGKLMVITPATGAVTSTRNVGNGMECLNDLTTFGEVEVAPADATPPAITPTVTGTRGQSGWYVSNVTINWSVTDGESAISSQTGCGMSTVTQDGSSFSFTCSATSAGGSSSNTVVVKRDATDPTITFTGNTGTYTVDQTVSISCAASDATSGIASTTCGSPMSTPAYQLGGGEFTFEGAATDNAGNSTTATTSYTVVVTHTGVCALTRAFSTSSGVADGLCDKLTAAAAASGRGNDKAASNILDAYRNQLRAQTGKAITAAEATILLNLLLSL